MSTARRQVDLPEVTISESRGIRYLHLDTPWIQGAMRIDDPLEIGRTADVSGDGKRAEPGSLASELLLAAGEHDDVRALPSERLGAREPEPGRGAADDRRAPA